MIDVVRNFIHKKEREILKNSNSVLRELNHKWKNIVEKDIYLTYPLRKEIETNISKYYNEISIPWYLFWDWKLKSKIYANDKDIQSCEKKLETYNSDFVAKKKKEYASLFKKGDLVLDDDQKTAIIKDDVHNLVVAGAGSGKTEVLTTRIAYLVKRKGDRIKPERILALAFQNKAADEIRNRLRKRYNIDIEIKTFHALGKKIIETYAKKNKIEIPRPNQSCCEERKFNNFIKGLFKIISLKSSDFNNKVIEYMKSYADFEIIKNETDFTEKEEYYKYMRSLRYTAINGQKVKSEGERAILNFFLMHKINGQEINIKYEAPAEWMRYRNEKGNEIIPKPDFFFPQFDIYLEHWAINKDGKVPNWFFGEDPTEEYIKGMNIKKKKYFAHKKELIETTYADFAKEDFLDKLEQIFLKRISKKKPKQKFKLERIPYEKLVNKTWESAQFVKSLPGQIANFITIAKTYNLDVKGIEERLSKEDWSKKQIAFSEIALIVFDYYQKILRKTNTIDFSDMINLAVKYLKSDKKLFEDAYDHILVDEFQDISMQRYRLIKELMNKNKNCKLFCVGDDCQSIMGFSGSNLNYFLDFNKYFDFPERTDLTVNYRSIKSVVDLGSEIIKHNKNQIKKKAVANSDLSKKIVLYSSLYPEKEFTNYYNQTIKHCFNKIKEYHDKGYSYANFMILLRISKGKIKTIINDVADQMKIPISFERGDLPNRVRVMTVHKSKGLQSKVVFILRLNNGIYGFPCQLHDPDIFEPAIINNNTLREQEERRLFYVAVTRAKEDVFMYTQQGAESKFIKEIEDFVKREELSTN